MAHSSTPTFPSRHMSQPEAWMPFVGKLQVFFPRKSLPDSGLCTAFGQKLSAGDPPMDRLVAWMFEEGMARTKPQFLQALEHGIDSLDAPPEALRTFFAAVDARPAWVDDQLLRAGSEAHAMMGHHLAFGLRDFVLMGGYLSSSINEVLALSGGLKSGALKRLAETSQWVMEITEPGGLDRFAPGFVSTIRVRWVHALIRRRIANMPGWDASTHGQPINQTDMIATWLGFAIGGPLSALMLGQWVLSPRDFKGFLHLYKYAHWLMGVDPQFLSDDAAQCAWMLANNTLTQPGPTEVSRQMAQALGSHKREQNYPRFSAIRGRWEQQQQLDRTRFFLGRRSMRDLGLPSTPLPLITLAGLTPRALSTATRRFLLPGQRQRLIQRGRVEQRRFMNDLYRGHSRAWQPEQASGIAVDGGNQAARFAPKARAI